MKKSLCLSLLLILFLLPIVSANLRIDSIRSSKGSVVEGENFKVFSRITNTGTKTEVVFVEGGLMPESWRGKAFAAPSINTVLDHPGCCRNNRFIDTFAIEVKPKTSVDLEFEVETPEKSTVDQCNNLGSAWDDSFVIIVGVFDRCSGGYRVSKTIPFTVNSKEPVFDPRIVSFVFPGTVSPGDGVTFRSDIFSPEGEGTVFAGVTVEGEGYICNLPFEEVLLRGPNGRGVDFPFDFPEDLAPGDYNIHFGLWGSCRDPPGDPECYPDGFCSGRIGSNSWTFSVVEGFECSSGPCCVNNEFALPTELCNTDIRGTYECRDNSMYAVRLGQFCSGSSSSCNGVIREVDSTFMVDCGSDYVCSEEEGDCVEKEEVSDEVPVVSSSSPVISLDRSSSRTVNHLPG